MPFAWTAISLREILKEIEQDTNLATHANTLPANSELINSANKASSLGRSEVGIGRERECLFRTTEYRHGRPSECLWKFSTLAWWESHSKQFEAKRREILLVVDFSIDSHQSFFVVRWILSCLGQFRSTDFVDLEERLQTGSRPRVSFRLTSCLSFRKAIDWPMKTFGSFSRTSGNHRRWRRSRKLFLVSVSSFRERKKERSSRV